MPAAAVSIGEWIAISHHHQGIRVSVLCPQAVATNIVANSPSNMRSSDDDLEGGSYDVTVTLDGYNTVPASRTVSVGYGAQVTAVDSTGKLEMLRTLAADEVVDYTQEDFTHGELRYDLILCSDEIHCDLLLGDAEQVPPFYRSTHYGDLAGTDLPYSTMDPDEFVPTPDLAIDTVMIFQDEMSACEAMKLMGWGMWRRRLQDRLPVEHPYRTHPPYADTVPRYTFRESTPAEFQALVGGGS